MEINAEILDQFNFEGAEFILKGTIREDDGFITVYECENFFGFSVTIAEKLIIEKIGSGVGFKYTFRASVCSPEDNFDPELGEDIVLGRIVKENEPDIIVDAKFESVESALRVVRGLTINKVEGLKAFVELKKERDQKVQKFIHEANAVLSDKFAEFK